MAHSNTNTNSCQAIFPNASNPPFARIARVSINMANQANQDRAIKAIEATMAASVRLRQGLLFGESIGETMIKHIKDGLPISTSVAASGLDPAKVRSSTLELLADFELCRHKMRLAFMLPSLDEGMSIGAIARTLGISRQLASRLVHEAREED